MYEYGIVNAMKVIGLRKRLPVGFEAAIIPLDGHGGARFVNQGTDFSL
jgi:hypothetical protein